ncbi:MAG: zinc ABC transporter substrate-binding protein, partial [Desulfamplus sp.]|nr:zinc ABC transporter substrate-binding protein [Desulfamplus sp.]
MRKNYRKTAKKKLCPFFISLFCFFIGFIISDSNFSKVSASEDKLTVFVSILPQKFFVEQIGKDRVDVHVMVQPGASPHTYEPRPQQMTALSKTDIYFAIGLPFEKVWLEKISATNKNMKIINTDDGIEKIQMVRHNHNEEGDDVEHKVTEKKSVKNDKEQNIKQKQELEPDLHKEHKHKGENKEHNGEPDPHIWLSPKLVIIQANHILEGLKSIDSKSGAFYDANYKEFILKIEKIDRDLKDIFKDKKGVKFMVFHPSWGYFARDYNIQEIPIEKEGKNPRPAELQELINHAREDKILVIFAQPQFSTKSAKQIAREINGEVVFADPLAYDWFKNLVNSSPENLE